MLAAAQRGDGGAYARFLKSILPFARAVARRRASSPEAVEDIVQDALLTIHRVRHTYEPGRPVSPWIAAIVTRRTIDDARKRGRIEAVETADEHIDETFADPAANRMEAAEAGGTVAALIEQLPPRQKQALELMKVKELSLKEASALSGQSIGALKVNVHRAMQRLKTLAQRSEP